MKLIRLCVTQISKAVILASAIVSFVLTIYFNFSSPPYMTNISCETSKTQMRTFSSIPKQIGFTEKIGYRDALAARHDSSQKISNPIRLFEGFSDSTDANTILNSTEGVSNVIFYVWCGKNRLFEFKHMLSVLSALKLHKPLRVLIFHWPEKRPAQDIYNDWLGKLTSTFFNVEVRHIGLPEPENCYDQAQYVEAVSGVFNNDGAIYFNENFTLTGSLNKYRHKRTILKSIGGQTAAIISRTVTPNKIFDRTKFESVACLNYNALKKESQHPCVFMSFDKLYPKDIMTNNLPFYALARTVFYGSENIRVPRYDISDPIPNIGHFYLEGPSKINLFVYLSIMSMITIVKVDTVYLHGNIEPTGKYWYRLKSSGKIRFVVCEPLAQIFGNGIGDSFRSKDIISVYVLYIYGGIFIDWDAIFTRPLDDAIRGYDVVVGYDWLIPEEAPTFPEAINPGVIAAKRHSPYLAMWLENYKEFGQKGGFYYTGLLVPYKLYEYYPEMVKLDSHFQVICWENTCHPPWLDGYHKENFHADFDWQTVYSVHFTYPDPEEFRGPKALNASNTPVAKMGKHILGWNCS